jgi:hypothetical protein
VLAVKERMAQWLACLPLVCAEVLRVVGSYLDAGSLLRLQCSSRSMTESLGEGGAWQKAFVRDFGFGLESLGPFGRM